MHEVQQLLHCLDFGPFNQEKRRQEAPSVYQNRLETIVTLVGVSSELRCDLVEVGTCDSGR